MQLFVLIFALLLYTDSFVRIICYLRSSNYMQVGDGKSALDTGRMALREAEGASVQG